MYTYPPEVTAAQPSTAWERELVAKLKRHDTVDLTSIGNMILPRMLRLSRGAPLWEVTFTPVPRHDPYIVQLILTTLLEEGRKMERLAVEPTCPYVLEFLRYTRTDAAHGELCMRYAMQVEP